MSASVFEPYGRRLVELEAGVVVRAIVAGLFFTKEDVVAFGITFLRCKIRVIFGAMVCLDF